MQGAPRTMQAHPRYGDVVAEVHGFVLERARPALEAGVDEVWVDPGIGFGKTIAHNLSLLHHLGELVAARRRRRVRRGGGRHQPQALPRGPGRGAGGPATEPRAGGRAGRGIAGHGGRRPGGGGRMVRVHDVAATVQVARLYGPAA